MVKKLIVISVIFAVLIGGSIWEIAYTTSTYKEIYDGLIKVEESFNLHEDVRNEQSLELMNAVYNKWINNKETLFCLGNHNILRMIDEKIVSLKAMVDTNYTDDAKIILQVTISLIKAVENDAVPNPTNMF